MPGPAQTFPGPGGEPGEAPGDAPGEGTQPRQGGLRAGAAAAAGVRPDGDPPACLPVSFR